MPPSLTTRRRRLPAAPPPPRSSPRSSRRRRSPRRSTLASCRPTTSTACRKAKGRGGFAAARGRRQCGRARCRAGPSSSIPATRSRPRCSPASTRAPHIIDILNQMGVDADDARGNHEFDFGKANFETRIGEAKFPVVTSNMREADGSQPPRHARHPHGRGRRHQARLLRPDHRGHARSSPAPATWCSSPRSGPAGRRPRPCARPALISSSPSCTRRSPSTSRSIARPCRRSRLLRPRRASARLLRRQDGAHRERLAGRQRRRHPRHRRQDREGRQDQRLLDAAFRHRRHQPR